MFSTGTDCNVTHKLVLFADAYVSIQNVHSYSPQLYSTLSTDATLLKVIAYLTYFDFCVYVLCILCQSLLCNYL